MPAHLTQGDWCYVSPQIREAVVSLHSDFTLGVPIKNAGDEPSTSADYVTVNLHSNVTNETITKHVQPPGDLAPGDSGHGTVSFGAAELVSGPWSIMVVGEHESGGNSDFHGGGIEVEDDRSHEA